MARVQQRLIAQHQVQLLRRMPDPLSDAQVKSYMLMLLRGVAHCHAHSIIHRVRVCWRDEHIVPRLTSQC